MKDLNNNHHGSLKENSLAKSAPTWVRFPCIEIWEAGDWAGFGLGHSLFQGFLKLLS